MNKKQFKSLIRKITEEILKEEPGMINAPVKKFKMDPDLEKLIDHEIKFLRFADQLDKDNVRTFMIRAFELGKKKK
jgi:hypothetical protein